MACAADLQSCCVPLPSYLRKKETLIENKFNSKNIVYAFMQHRLWSRYATTWTAVLSPHTHNVHRRPLPIYLQWARSTGVAGYDVVSWATPPLGVWPARLATMHICRWFEETGASDSLCLRVAQIIDYRADAANYNNRLIVYPLRMSAG